MATDTCSEYAIIIDFSWQQWLLECVSTIYYMCIAFLVYNVVEGENKSVTLYENFV